MPFDRRPPIPERGALGRAVDRATGLRAIPGNAVHLLTAMPDIYGTMQRVINEAAENVHFENYIIRDDATGKRFSDWLAAAAQRGVTVRVLYDHLGCRSTRRSFWRRLDQAGVDVRPFNRVNPFRPIRSLQRDHRKYVSSDGACAILGGMCIGDEWAGDAARAVPPWRDTAVAIRGPAVSALDLTFARKWSEAGGDSTDIAQRSVEPPGDVSVNVIDGVPGKLRVYRALELLAASAAERIWITDAYLVAPPPLFRNLLAAARDGVDVRLLLPGQSDIAAIRAFTRVGYRELLRSGVRIWEWQGAMLHAKTAIIDRSWFKVGSSNLNPSSLFSNLELDVLIYDRNIAAESAHQFLRDINGSIEIMLRRARVPGRIGVHLPPAVVQGASLSESATEAGGGGRRSRRAVLTLRHVAVGARRSILGAAIFLSMGVGVLFLALPRFTAYTVAAISFWLAGSAVWHFFHRRA
jgi:cardiolipin synthase